MPAEQAGQRTSLARSGRRRSRAARPSRPWWRPAPLRRGPDRAAWRRPTTTISCGMVAEKNMVCRCAGTCRTMRRIGTMKPRSSMWSASSSTSTSTRSRRTARSPIRSSSRPGVATSTSMPPASVRACRPLRHAAEHDGRHGCPSRGRADGSSRRSGRRVRGSGRGSARAARSARRAGLRRSRSRIGRAKAAVLPVPVWAMPSTSRPASAGGIACAWIGVGAVYCAPATAFSNGMERPRSEKEVMQVFQVRPRAAPLRAWHGPSRSAGPRTGANVRGKQLPGDRSACAPARGRDGHRMAAHRTASGRDRNMRVRRSKVKCRGDSVGRGNQCQVAASADQDKMAPVWARDRNVALCYATGCRPMHGRHGRATSPGAA